MTVAGKKVFVGLSGGVDSAVTAALLTQMGAQVTGVFIKGWYPPGMPCTWNADRRDAMRVAARLQIPFRTLDASDEYKLGVIDYLLSEYKAGRTPNPDVMCNREVKFGAFFDYAMQEGADLIATGHYARIEDGHILRGVSEAKDQSYFLWAVPKDALKKVIFPLGAYEKPKVRALASRFGLPVSDKRDSQGICFLGDISVDAFLKHEFGTEVGEAVDECGTVVGEHAGALLYTLGERVALQDAPPGPWFVVAKDVESNRLTVAKSLSSSASRPTIELTEMNLQGTLEVGKEYEAQYRYHGPRIQVRVEGSRISALEPLSEPVAAGQSLVIYDGDELVGGGVIS